HWGNNIYFSATDNTDPRTNGRHYRAVVSGSLLSSFVWLFLLIGTAGFLWLVLQLPALMKRWQAPKATSTRLLMRSENSIFLRLAPLVFAALPSLILFAVVPPIYTDMT